MKRSSKPCALVNLVLAGPVDARHAYVDMSAVKVAASNWTRAGRTCSPAMGFSFAGGTTDGVPPSGALCTGCCTQLYHKTCSWQMHLLSAKAFAIVAVAVPAGVALNVCRLKP